MDDLPGRPCPGRRGLLPHHLGEVREPPPVQPAEHLALVPLRRLHRQSGRAPPRMVRLHLPEDGGGRQRRQTAA